MKEIEKLAREFLTLKKKKIEKRRYIDYDMVGHLRNLNQSNLGLVENTFQVKSYELEIESHESEYNDISNELYENTKDLSPLLAALKASRENPLIVHVNGKTYFDVFLDENGVIQSRDFYTDLSK